MIVVDASIAVKLYRDEAHSEAALSFFESHAGQITAPDLLMVEVAGVIVREANMRQDTDIESRRKLANFASLLNSSTVKIVRSDPSDIVKAATIGIEIGHPIKDCIYLALAMKLDCELVTADARFAAKARDVWGKVRELGG